MPEISPEDIAREERRTSLYDVMELAAAYFEENLQTSAGAAARGYLADRGLTAGVQQQFRIGYAPAGRNNLKAFLVDKGNWCRAACRERAGGDRRRHCGSL